VAVLSAKISSLQSHQQTNKKDLHSRRGLVAMIEKRRKLLQYLKRKDFSRYNLVIEKLRIRPVQGVR